MKDDCKRCQRKGLSILPVIYAVAPNEALKSYETPKGKTKNYGVQVYNRSLKETAYYLRRPGPGYIYLLYPNNVWKGYLIDSAGYPRYYPDLLTEDMPSEIPKESEVVACERQGGGDHTGAECICIESPDTLKGMVWIAYSRARWTKNVRDEYAKSPAVRMQFITPLNGNPFNHAEVASVDALKEYLVDFSSPLVSALNKTLPASEQIRDMSGREASLIKFMQTASGKLDKPGVIMALYDPIGITTTLNDFRNALIKEGQSLESGAQTDKENFEIAALIENVRDSVTENGGDWARYEKNLDKAKYDPVKNEFLKRRDLVKRAAKVSADFVKWINADHTKYLFAHDFEIDCKVSGLDLENCFVKCVQGSGVTPAEKEEVWNLWFAKDPGDPDNILWRAAAANDKKLLETLANEKMDKLFDATKGGVGAFKETRWFEHMHNAWAAVQQRRQQLPEFRQATHDLAVTLGAQLVWLRGKSNADYFRTAARLASIVVTRGDMLLISRNVTAPAHKFVAWAEEAYLGRPRAAVPLDSRLNSKQKDPRGINRKKIADQEARAYSGAIEGTLMVDLSKREAPLAFSAWVISKLEPGKDMNTDLAREFRKLGLDPAEFAMPEKFKFNPLSKEARGLKNARVLDRPLSSISGIFALFSYMKAADDLAIETQKSGQRDDEKIYQARASKLTAIASGVAAGIEIRAASKVIAQRGVETLGVRVLGLSAGVIACGVGLTDAHLAWRKGKSLEAKGDGDAAKLAKASAYFGAAGAATGFAGAVMIFAGVTGTWLVAVLGASIVLALRSVAYDIEADDKTDTELELWMNRSRFGIRTLPDCKEGYVSLKEEMTGFLCAVYALRIVKRIDSAISREVSATFSLKVDLVLPYFGKNSWMEVSLVGEPQMGEKQTLYTAVYDKGLAAGQEIRVAPLLKMRRLTGQQEASSLIVKGFFSIEQRSPVPRVPIALNTPRPLSAAAQEKTSRKPLSRSDIAPIAKPGQNS